ncbi:patatin-like phospholipase family protein [Demequina sp.]|uniref:patatin-like phospholipase family protein n=1 Tax=Demequina sp. TaxID=2050685 RepID=UPI003A891438
MEAIDDLRTTPRLGLALGGGGALGAAHVGVLQVLRERGIRPTVVTGTSAGSIVGAAYALGLDPYVLEDWAARATWGTFGTFAPRPGKGILSADALRALADRVAGERNIEDLSVTFGAVATDWRTREAVVVTQGELAEAVAASIAVPGVFRPVTIEGRELVDGGIVQNLPIEACFDLGATHVIGVRIAPEWDALGHQALHVHEYLIRADVTYIRPLTDTRSQWITKDLPELVDIGREAAERALADYPIVNPRPPRKDLAAEPDEDPSEPVPGVPSAESASDSQVPPALRGVSRFLRQH